MNTKFTKGPWSQSHRKDKSGGYSTEVYDSNGETICTLDWYVAPTEKGFTTNRDENARLIACAPDMYEMLESACSELYSLINEVNKERLSKVHSQTETPPDLHDMETCNLIQQLLKRARGE